MSCNFVSIRRPGLPDLPVPSLPSLSFTITLPITGFPFPLPDFKRPGLPDLPVPSLPSLSFAITMPIDFPLPLPAFKRPGLPDLPVPSLPSLVFPIVLPAPPCPMDAVGALLPLVA